MSYVLEDSTEMAALASAIRTKTGSNASMSVSDMATAVSGISGGSITYLKTNSSNAGSSATNTVITLPSSIQGGSKDFFICVKNVNSSGNLNGQMLYYYSHSNNTFTQLSGGFISSGVGFSSCSWNNSSTKTQVKIVANGNITWKANSTSYDHVVIIY